jgi:hypothetical protein
MWGWWANIGQGKPRRTPPLHGSSLPPLDWASWRRRWRTRAAPTLPFRRHSDRWFLTRNAAAALTLASLTVSGCFENCRTNPYLEPMVSQTPRTWKRQSAIYRYAAAQLCLKKSHPHEARNVGRKMAAPDAPIW